MRLMRWGKGIWLARFDIRFERIGTIRWKATMPVDHRTNSRSACRIGGASVVLAESIGSVAGYLCTGEQKVVGLEVNANFVMVGVRAYECP